MRWNRREYYDGRGSVETNLHSLGFFVLLFCVLSFIFMVGCAERRDYGTKIVERPEVNIPIAMRESNYSSGGSCVHASLITLLRWQGKERLAKDWRRDFRGGEFARSVAVKLDSRGIRYAYTTKGDVRFLEWACRTKRGCGITVNGGAHMITLVHLDAKWAAVLDNNSTSRFIWIPRDELVAEWKRSYGWAVTPMYSPLAPLPH